MQSSVIKVLLKSLPVLLIMESLFSVVAVQSLSCVRLFATPWTAAHQAPLSFTISCGLFKLMSIESVVLSNPLILCCPLPFLPSIFPSLNNISFSVLFFAHDIVSGVQSGIRHPKSLQSKRQAVSFSLHFEDYGPQDSEQAVRLEGFQWWRSELQTQPQTEKMEILGQECLWSWRTYHYV